MCRLVITFLPRSKHLLISWLQSPSAVILEPKKRKSVTVSIVLGDGSKEILLLFISKSVLPIFFFRSLYFVLIHFEFIFMYGVRKCSSFILEESERGE